jgi:hypothetical protein
MKRPRGVCPVCRRELALRDDRALPGHNPTATRRHNEPVETCRGSGGQPADQASIDELLEVDAGQRSTDGERAL